jgi:serine phosphatase RsbU (regulator of sigma subunit)
MPAALLSAAVRPEIRHAVRDGAPPAEVLARVNRHVYDGGFDTRFVTMILVELDPSGDRLTVASAGHERPLIRRADGMVETLEMPGVGLPLGLDPAETYAPTSLRLAPGEVLILHSDGLMEAQDRNQALLGPGRVARAISEAPGFACAVGEALVQAVMKHAEGRAPFDDLTIVCVGREAP